MKKTFTLALFAISANLYAQQKTISGFSPASVTKQVALEQAFDKAVSAKRIGENVKQLSAYPHHIGSPGGKAVAEAILAKYKSYGLDAHIETYTVLFPTPKVRVLELTAPTKYTAVLKEPALKADATSGQLGQLPTYNAWSADGDVSGALVFVNYGLPEDYDRLDILGISVKGKIVIAKYGRSWRGIKPKVAYEHGAIGCLIYSDPKDDGYLAGDVYPKGAFKNEYGVQRGSVMDMVLYPGDPLTPGVGSTKDAKRLDRKDATTILKIPVLPISYHDAKPLLAALEGPVAPADWTGGLPITYHIGGVGKAKVHLKLQFDWKQVPAYDVIAMIKGSTYPDQWVMRGNHHDAWVNGAADPISGQSIMLDEARVLGELMKTGWRPKRSMVFCSWDGEEPGLMGSTEYVEAHDKELQEKAVVYINTDDTGRGFLGVGGSHALEGYIDEITHDVTDPETKVSLFDRNRGREAVNAVSAKAKKEALEKNSAHIGALGSGSDYSPFFQHLGIPSLNLGFGGEDAGGDYHSIYDSYDDYVRFKDGNFAYGATLASVAGRAALRMANADVLPFDMRSLYSTINKYAAEVNDLAAQMRESTAADNLLIKTNSYAYAADPTKKLALPVARPEVPALNFEPLTDALDKLKKATNKLADTWATAAQSDGDHSKLNKMLYQAEQQLLNPEGLPRRDWYKHTIYAPGFYTGYGVKTIPGVREAIEQRNWAEAQQQIGVVSKQILQLAEYLGK